MDNSEKHVVRVTVDRLDELGRVIESCTESIPVHPHYEQLPRADILGHVVRCALRQQISSRTDLVLAHAILYGDDVDLALQKACERYVEQENRPRQ